MPQLAYADSPSEHQPLLLRGDPNGLAYDRQSSALYVADGHGGAIYRIEGPHVYRLATIESGGVIAANRLGGVTVTPYGTVFVTRLGYGRASAVFRIEPDGCVEPVAGLSPEAWRLGITYDPHEHVVYTTEFLKGPEGPHTGSILAIDLATNEIETVAIGLSKPVGVVKLGSDLVVTDAKQRSVIRLEVRGGLVVRRRTIADGERFDSLCACGPDSVLVTSYDAETRRGQVRQLWTNGHTRMIATGDWEPRGVATDGDSVFVAARRAGRVLVFAR